MQATIGLVSLKPFTRALACLCRYGDEIILHATPQWLTLSVDGVGSTSFCRFKFARTFFDRGYRVGNSRKTGKTNREEDDTDVSVTYDGEEDAEEQDQVFGMVTGKLFLAVLRGSGTEKNAEKCYMELVEPGETDGEDSVETRLVLKMQYKHGVILTHTLPLADSDRPNAPRLPSNRSIGTIRIGGRTLKELIEHFPKPEKRAGGDPLLIWQFYNSKAMIKTEDKWSDGILPKKNPAGLLGEEDEDEPLLYSTVNSQLTLEESEFEAYDIFYAPVTLGIYLKELNATLAVAEALGSEIVLRFTASGQPVFFTLESPMGTYSAFCALSTKVMKEAKNDGKQPTTRDASSLLNARQDGDEDDGGRRKRQRDTDMEVDEEHHVPKRKNGINPTAASTSAFGSRAPPLPRSGSHARSERNNGDPSFFGVSTSTPRPNQRAPPRRGESATSEEPLFYPETDSFVGSQAAPPASQVLRDAGLEDLEQLTQAEVTAMLADGDDDFDMEVDDGGGMRFDEASIEGGMSPFAMTQRSAEDDFRPLFED